MEFGEHLELQREVNQQRYNNKGVLMKKFNSFSFFLLIILLLVTGCREKQPAGMPALYTTTITFTQEGRPLDGAGVRLVSLDTSNRWVSGGLTNGQGVLTVKTQGKYPGAPLGTFKVCISKTITEGGDGLSEMERAERGIVVKPSSRPKSWHLVPLEYDKSEETPWQIEIKKGKNSYQFDIPKSVKIEIPYGGV